MQKAGSVTSCACADMQCACSMAIASVAQHDFPTKWPALLPHLVGTLQGGPQQVEQVNAGMRCLVLVCEEMHVGQLALLVSELVSPLHQVFLSSPPLPAAIRATACSLVFKALKLGG